jgi:hypothetical protein
MYGIKLDYLEEKFAKNVSCVKGEIRIRYNYSGSGFELAKKFRFRLDPD